MTTLAIAVLLGGLLAACGSDAESAAVPLGNADGFATDGFAADLDGGADVASPDAELVDATSSPSGQDVSSDIEDPSDVAPGDAQNITDGAGPSDVSAPPADIAIDTDATPGDTGDTNSGTESDALDVSVPSPLTQDDFDAAMLDGTVGAFVDAYDAPICDADGCLIVTEAPGVSGVSVLGEFNGWSDDAAVWLTEVPDEPGVFYGVLPPIDGDGVVEYKLKHDGDWTLDPSNPYVVLAGFGPNSAIYGPERGRLTVRADVYSPELENSRSLYVYLPAAYFTDLSAEFPVLYMQDGFNVFQNPQAPFGTWDVEAALDSEIAAGTVAPVIVVGIDTADRFAEYTYGKFQPDAPEPQLPAYAQFLVETVKPLVDSTFRTRTEPEYTAIAGSSLGGISSLWIGLTHSDVFGAAASLSGSFWIGEDGSTTPMRTLIADGVFSATPQTLRIYLDSGSVSSSGTGGYSGDSWVYSDWTRNALITQGWSNRPEWDTDDDIATPPTDLPVDTEVVAVPHLAWSEGLSAALLGPEQNLVSLVGIGQGHNEAAWKARFPIVVRYLFFPE